MSDQTDQTNNVTENLDPLAEKREALAQEVQRLVKEASGDSTETNSEVTQNTETSQPVIEQDPWEVKARAIGWKSEDERIAEGKSNDHFVPAKEYVQRQPLFERIEKQKKEIEETRILAKEAMDNLIKLRKEAYEASIRQVESQKLRAVEEGDTIQYQRIEAQAESLRNQQANDPIINRPDPIQQPAPELTEFQSRNSSWYNHNTNENRKMVAAAQAIDNFLVAQAQIEQGLPSHVQPILDKTRHLQEVEARIKKEFAHRFENQQRTAPAVVGRSTASTGAVSKPTDLVSKMTAQQRHMADYFVRTSNGKHTLEEYAKELDAMGRLGK